MSAKNIERLSSGLRINSAADDASGLVISESLRAQSAGLTQATSNTNDAINVVKTAEGALNEVHSLLINIRSAHRSRRQRRRQRPDRAQSRPGLDCFRHRQHQPHRRHDPVQQQEPSGRHGQFVVRRRHDRHRHRQQHGQHQPGPRFPGRFLRHHGHCQRPCRLHAGHRLG